MSILFAGRSTVYDGAVGGADELQIDINSNGTLSVTFSGSSTGAAKLHVYHSNESGITIPEAKIDGVLGTVDFGTYLFEVKDGDIAYFTVTAVDGGDSLDLSYKLIKEEY